MPTTAFDLLHTNTSIFARRQENDYEVYIDAGKRIKFSFTGTACRLFAKNDYADGITKGFAVSIDGGAYTLYGPTAFGAGTLIATGLAEGTHTVEIDGDYNNAGAGTLKFRKFSAGGAIEVMGAAPSVQYAASFGRVRHFGDATTDTLRQLAGWMSLAFGAVLSFNALAGGLNAGSQIRIKTADRYVKCYYTSRGNAPEVTIYDGRLATRGAKLVTGSLGSSSEDGILTLDTGITDGVARELVLGVNGVPPAAIATEGAGLLAVGADWPIAVAFGTSLACTAGNPNKSTKSWPNQVAVRQGQLMVNLAKGGSSLSSYGGIIAGDPNGFGRDREDEAATIAPSVIYTGHFVNDAHAASTGYAVTSTMFETELISHLTALTALPSVETIYALGGETSYEAPSRAEWLPKIHNACDTVNATNGDTRCIYISTGDFYADVELYDGVHPTEGGADTIADGINAAVVASSDTTAPTLDTAETSSGGVQLLYTFNEPMGTGVAGLTPKINGTPVSVLASSWSVDNLTLTQIIASGITSTDSVTFDYDTGTGDITDAAGNELLAIAGRTITNNSTVSGGGSGNGEEYMTVSQASPDEPTIVTSAAYVKIGSSGESFDIQFDGPLIVRSVMTGGAQPTPDKKGRKIGVAGVALNYERFTLTGTDLWAIASNGPVSVWPTK